jgi:hypothetical protein
MRRISSLAVRDALVYTPRSSSIAESFCRHIRQTRPLLRADPHPAAQAAPSFAGASLEAGVVASGSPAGASSTACFTKRPLVLTRCCCRLTNDHVSIRSGSGLHSSPRFRWAGLEVTGRSVPTEPHDGVLRSTRFGCPYRAERAQRAAAQLLTERAGFSRAASRRRVGRRSGITKRVFPHTSRAAILRSTCRVSRKSATDDRGGTRGAGPSRGAQPAA